MCFVFLFFYHSLPFISPLNHKFFLATEEVRCTLQAGKFCLVMLRAPSQISRAVAKIRLKSGSLASHQEYFIIIFSPPIYLNNCPNFMLCFGPQRSGHADAEKWIISL